MNTDAFERRIAYLKSGKALLLKHEIYGQYKVFMNEQQNGIFACPLDDAAKKIFGRMVKTTDLTLVPDPNGTDHDRINHFLMWGLGDWFEYTEPVIEICPYCQGKGKTETHNQLVSI